jgi:hypothetical protein
MGDWGSWLGPIRGLFMGAVFGCWGGPPALDWDAFLDVGGPAIGTPDKFAFRDICGDLGPPP